MNKKNLFKLHKYCINFYCHLYHNDIYLTDNEWLNIFSLKKYYNKFLNKIKTKDIFASSTDYVDDCFFLSINYDINRFKRILKLLQNNNIFHEFNIVENIIDLPIVLISPISININEEELLQLLKTDNSEYVYNQAKIILNKYDYHFAPFYYGKFLKAYLQYMQNFRVSYSSINTVYSQFFSLRHNYKQYKLDNDILSSLFNKIFINMLTNDILSIKNILINFAENLNIYFARNIDEQCINNIYQYIYNNYIIKSLSPYNMYFTIVSMSKLYELLNFNKEQKKNMKNFINKVKAEYLLMQL